MMDLSIWPVSRSTTHGGIIAWRVDDLVSFPVSLNGACAMLRAYVFVDAVSGRPTDPYIAAELARHV